MNTEGKFLYGDREKRHWDRVAVFGPTYGPDIYDASPAGLAEALAAAVIDETVVLPMSTLTGDFVVPDGVRLLGRGKDSIVVGQVTFGLESTLEDLWIFVDENDDADHLGAVVSAPASVVGDLCYVRGCTIYILQSGVVGGDSIALYAQDNLDVQIWDSDLYGLSAAASGYAIKRRALDQGNVYMWGGRCRGSTAPFRNGTG